MDRDTVRTYGGDAAGMQHSASGGRDFLSFGVVESAQEAGRWDDSRVRAEHPRDVGPNLQELRLEFDSEVRCRRVGASPAQEHGFATRVVGDEPLRDDRTVCLREELAELRIGLAGTLCRENA